MVNPARILINDYAGHPFQIQLSRALASAGHDVAHLYCSTNVTPRGDLGQTEDRHLTIHPISTGSTFEKYSLAKRVRDEVRYGRSSARFQREWKPDVVICSNVPVVSLELIQRLDRSTPMVLWLQDIQSNLASLVLKGWRSLLHRPFAFLERDTIRHATAVVAIADSLAEEAHNLGANPARSSVIENWAPIADLPMMPKDNAWAQQHQLTDHFVFLYSGTLGIKHRPDLLVDLAVAFRDDPAVKIVVASEGVGAEQLADEAIEHDLDNLLLLPFQDFSDLAPMLASADVLTVVLEQDAGSSSIPSKILSYLCAGRPILGSLPADNSSTDLIDQRANAGLSATDDATFIANARLLRSDAEIRRRLGSNGREYAEANFEIDQIVQQFNDVIGPLLGDVTVPADIADSRSKTTHDHAVLTDGGNR